MVESVAAVKATTVTKVIREALRYYEELLSNDPAFEIELQEYRDLQETVWDHMNIPSGNKLIHGDVKSSG